LFRARTGVPWRDLPERYGPWQTLQERHRRWSADGTWQMILEELQIQADAADPDGALARALEQEQKQREREWAVNIDSSSCRAHQCSPSMPGRPPPAATSPARRPCRPPQITPPTLRHWHVVGNDAISVWMVDHPGIYEAAMLGVTVEHLGATMWANMAGQYVATGGFDWGTTYTMQRNPANAANAEQNAYLSAVAAVNASGWPNYPVATVRPGTIPLYLGEGAPLYTAGLGTVSLIPAPTYLLQAGDAQHPDLLDLDKLDEHLMYGQILTFAQTIQASTPPHQPRCRSAPPLVARKPRYRPVVAWPCTPLPSEVTPTIPSPPAWPVPCTVGAIGRRGGSLVPEEGPLLAGLSGSCQVCAHPHVTVGHGTVI
jgi:Putative transposase of IS4/5 family (DUF4096)